MTADAITVLLVEDSTADAILIEELLSEYKQPQISLIRATKLEDAIEISRSLMPDLALLDLNLPDSNGMETIQAFRDQAYRCAVIVLTGNENEELGIRALKSGAQDYIIKNNLESDLMLRAIRYSIERHSLTEHLLELSLTDDLTGILNRRGFKTLANQTIHHAKRSKLAVCVMILDLDNLKTINDIHGHDYGDQAIKAIADILKRNVRESDLVARIGGDEYALLGLEGDDLMSSIVRKRIRDEVEMFNKTNEAPFTLGFSIGSYRLQSPESMDLELLMRKADEEMYKEKYSKKGKNATRLS